MFEIVNKLYGIEMKEVTQHLSQFYPRALSLESPTQFTLSPARRDETAACSLPLEGRVGERCRVENNLFSNIQIYEVSRNGKFLAYFFTDFFYRPLKRQGAWANILRETHNDYKKLVVNVCNFQK